jgi:hypothetical protein
MLSVPGLEAVPLLVAAQVHMALLTPQPGALQAARKFTAAAELCHEHWQVVQAVQPNRVRDVSPHGIAILSKANGLQRQTESVLNISI